MYNKWQLATRYLRYYATALNGKGHGMHSPFVYRLIRDVLNNRQSFPAYKQVEQLRERLKKDNTLLHVEDFGAGSVHGTTQQRSISSIARNAAKPAKYGQLLFRLANYYECQTMLEIGTSLGISTTYLALARPGGEVITVEGAPAIATAAAQNFESLGISNIRQKTGDFDHILPGLLEQTPPFDLVFIDGNHRQEPTLRYFEWLLPHLHNDAVLIFDDIHWSAEMEKAWEAICNHPAARCTIDLFFVGLVFLRREFHEPQHFRIRF